MPTKTIGKSPCYKCENREPGCHAKCEVYINWKGVHAVESETVRANRKATYFDPRAVIRSDSVDNRIKERRKR